jgi:hypothetical protein
MFAIFGISLILHAQRNIELPDGQPILLSRVQNVGANHAPSAKSQAAETSREAIGTKAAYAHTETPIRDW